MKFRIKKNGNDSLDIMMKNRRITYSWLARETGISRQHLQKIVRGEIQHSNTENYNQIAEALKMRINYDEEGLFFEDLRDQQEIEELPKDIQDFVDFLVSVPRPKRLKLLKVLEAIYDKL